jgi:ribosomal protein S9
MRVHEFVRAEFVVIPVGPTGDARIVSLAAAAATMGWVGRLDAREFSPSRGRDSRVVERKKYGRRKACRSFQFSKH